MQRIIAGRDSVLIDAYAATLLGYQPSEIGHVRIAADIGLGSMDLSCAVIEELNRPDEEPFPTIPSRQAEQYLRFIEQNKACSACVGSIIHALRRLDDSTNLSRCLGKLHVGQGFKTHFGTGVGIGNCASGFEKCLKGCPPPALDIRRFIEELLHTLTD
jgi:hypothetical protein